MTIDLLSTDAVSIRYHDGGELDLPRSPRPYLTASVGGIELTAVEPADHLHHLGVSVAIPDVNGVTFWGGRTFVRGAGSTMLPNHGQQVVRSREVGDGHLVERLAWTGPDGELLLDEQRSIAVRERGDGIELLWSTDLLAANGPVSFGSPQTNGRDDAFYGGIFWRAAFPTARVRCADGEGVDAAHGSSSPWLAVDGSGASLVATTRNSDMPWFVRAEGYVGFGPAVAVTGRREMAAGESLRLDLAVAILDRPSSDPAAIARRLGAHAVPARAADDVRA